MFLDFYNLRDQPFGVTPDPRFLYLSATHREALASILYGVESGRGFTAMIANPGMGKTTLLYCLLERLRSTARTAFIFQTQCTSHELLRYLAADLGVECNGADVVEVHQRLNHFLVREAERGGRVVVIIDEAQNLSEEVLESVRLLTNFETPRAKLVQVILAGQPPLADKLGSPSMAQLLQRVSICARLTPFTSSEVDGYINHRLRIAGHTGKDLFSSEARSMIAEHSEGIPRNINNLCFNALSIACALRKKTVDASMVEEVLGDLDVRPLGSEPPADSDAPPAPPPARPEASHGSRGRGVLASIGVTLARPRSPAHDDGSSTPQPKPPAVSPEIEFSRPTAPRPKPRPGGGLEWALMAGLLLAVSTVAFTSRQSLETRRAWANSVTSRLGSLARAVLNAASASSDRNVPASASSDRAGEGISWVLFSSTRQPDVKVAASASPDSGGKATWWALLTSTRQPDVKVSASASSDPDREGTKSAAVSSIPQPRVAEMAALPNQTPSGPGSTTVGNAGSTAGSGWLQVRANLKGARISIDGGKSFRWLAPSTLTLPAGTYRVEIAREGYETDVQIVQVRPNFSSSVFAKLTPAGGPRLSASGADELVKEVKP
jgi:type II secretory pathway predicted ATPase ExeA